MQISGKDLMLLILKYDLMDSMFDASITDDSIFMSTEQTAVKLGISTTSLLDMANLGLIDSVDIDGKKYFYKDIDLSSIRKERV